MLQDERDDGEKLLVVAVFVSPVNLKRGRGISRRACMQSAMVHLEKGETHTRMQALDLVRLAAALPQFFQGWAFQPGRTMQTEILMVRGDANAYV
jgi:hypothetical protein